MIFTNMLFWFFLIILLICLVVAGFIVVRKFPQLSNLDVANLPDEQQSLKKRQLIEHRLREKGKMVSEKLHTRFSPLVKFFKLLQLQFRIYVGKIERLWHHEQTVKVKSAPVPPQDREDARQKLAALIQEAANAVAIANWERAEDLYISAIKIDQKSAAAYRGLGDVYAAKGSLEEARQTYQFVLQLDPDDDMVMVKLAEMAESQGDIEDAINYYQQAVLVNDSLSPRFYHLAELLLKVSHPQVAKEAIVQAVELEPRNPKFLDLLIEVAILCGDKPLAQKGWNDLRMVNPDNNKLNDFSERIGRI